MTKILLIRHAECEGNIKKALTGRTEYQLTKAGKEMAQKLAEELKKYKIDKIYSSPSVRCIDTVAPTAEYFKLDIIRNENLLEKYFGIYDGWTWDEVEKENPQILINKKKYNSIVGIKNQESSEQVEKRMNRYIREIAEENNGKTIAVCSHGCSIEIFLRSIDNVSSVDMVEKYRQSNAAIDFVEYDDHIFKIVKLNQIQHLV